MNNPYANESKTLAAIFDNAQRDRKTGKSWCDRPKYTSFASQIAYLRGWESV